MMAYYYINSEHRNIVKTSPDNVVVELASEGDGQFVANCLNDAYANGRNDAANTVRELIYRICRDVIDLDEDPYHISIELALRELVARIKTWEDG